ncbi:MAG TPA: beta/gamma crystallin-related protein [Casimicrobium huifangae]|jgi:hypothetical protein|uniref:beta/gamma crystallin-related protein n=1 Tax=Casimicrobium huifangae TaxID=2591109 RepID=UPI002BBFA6F2|nr:beta/gamma crystallin-related protein [Casimicrobium huifangae]HQA33222.1 beta/gamma crystallin-related protein [Casimicrobium huifangae]HQD65694.1 beta/gamma crystallin-related protein [Casimicrobium huifangae]
MNISSRTRHAFGGAPKIAVGALLLAAMSSGVAAASDVWLYSGRDFTGAFARISRSEANLPIGAARSLRVATGVWEACTGANFTGDCRRLSPGDYRELGGRYGDTVMSLRDVTYASAGVGYAPARIQLYDRTGFRGRTMTYEQSIADIDAGSRFTAASAIVTGGTWEVCTDYNFGGRCQALPPGQYNDLGSQLNYRIVSVRVVDGGRPTPLPAVPPIAVAPPPVAPPPAWNNDRVRVEVFTNPNFTGAAMTLDNDIDNLRNSGFNDRIQSMRVFGGNWEACEDRDFGGSCMVFGPGDYRRLPPQLDRSISSLRRVGEPSWNGLVPGGGAYVVMDQGAGRSRHPVWLYEHSNFNGRTVRATGDVADLGSSGLNDATSSIFISFGTWQFCEDSNYRGRCLTLGPGQYNEMPPGMNDSISSFRRVR